jgi:hypothetical protein
MGLGFVLKGWVRTAILGHSVSRHKTINNPKLFNFALIKQFIYHIISLEKNVIL